MKLVKYNSGVLGRGLSQALDDMIEEGALAEEAEAGEGIGDGNGASRIAENMPATAEGEPIDEDADAAREETVEDAEAAEDADNDSGGEEEELAGPRAKRPRANGEGESD